MALYYGIDPFSILFRFSDDAFNNTFISTIGIDFKIKTIELRGKKIKLQARQHQLLWVQEELWLLMVKIKKLTDLGHRGTRTFPHYHHELLQGGHGNHARVWYHQLEELRQHCQVVEEHPGQKDLITYLSLWTAFLSCVNVTFCSLASKYRVIFTVWR